MYLFTQSWSHSPYDVRDDQLLGGDSYLRVIVSHNLASLWIKSYGNFKLTLVVL